MYIDSELGGVIRHCYGRTLCANHGVESFWRAACTPNL